MEYQENRSAKRGFTVLEVLVALTVFSLVTLTVFAVFRAAVKSQRVGERETKIVQRARFAMDTIEGDLTNIFFRDETAYNVTLERQISQMEQSRLQAEQNNDWESFYSNYGNPNDPDSEDSARIGNPYEKGRLIDVQMQGKAHSMTFAAHDPLSLGEAYRPFGLSRIKYFVDEGLLMRSASNIDAKERNQFGEIEEFPEPPSFSRLAEGVDSFTLRYAFWFDNQWYETKSWTSSQRLIRNPQYLLGDYGDDDDNWGRGQDDWGENDPRSRRGAGGRPIEPGEPGWNEFVNDQYQEPLDRLPAAVRVELVLSDPENPSRKQTFQRIIRILAAEETYAPRGLLNEDERENERFLRDRKYQMIWPGALDEF